MTWAFPVYVYLSICNATRTVYRYQPPNGSVREIVACPEIYIDNFQVDLIDAMRPAFNTLWNAVGHLQCERYNDLARWKESNPYALDWRSY
jgi:hypothetical protein